MHSSKQLQLIKIFKKTKLDRTLRLKVEKNDEERWCHDDSGNDDGTTTTSQGGGGASLDAQQKQKPRSRGYVRF